MNTLLIVVAAFGLATPAPGPDFVEAVSSVPRTGEIVIDGILDEPGWQQAPATTGFVQRDPVEGVAPTERTAVYVLYDDDALYVGARLFDSAPDSIVARLGRRDSFLDSDRFMVHLDPYHDRRSGYFFSVTAGGTLDDGILLNDDWNDSDWDGVWQGRAMIDDQGWCVEMRIPYSQLRFFRRDEYTWGVNFRRDITRRQERDYLVYTPRGESGFVSRFPELTGLRSIQPRRQFEVIPYVTTRAGYDQATDGNPFDDGSRYTLGAGADLRVGLTPNLSLNGTINPDFGQVEVDPAVINLSDNETFYPEKRPFFIEGSTVFQNFGFGGANDHWGFNWGNPEFFYSRRIGRAPQGALPDHSFADVPDGARILGASKVTGKIGGSWNVGMVHALTSRESARLQIDDALLRREVEPAAYYGVFRAQKELARGRHGIGLLSTVTQRAFEADHLRADLNEQALVFGLDGWVSLDAERKWVLLGWTGASRVSGSRERITALQEGPLHYFQRPDADHISVDSTARSMTGVAGRISLNKQRGRVAFNTAIGTVSPGFEVNDLGFQGRADVVNGHMMLGYRWPDPARFTRNAFVGGALFGSFDYEGNRIWSGIWGRTFLEFLSYHFAGIYFAYNPQNVNNRLTRGGPLTLNLPGYEVGVFGGTDTRKAIVLNAETGTYQSESGTNVFVSPSIEWKPAANASISVGPSLSWTYEPAQWVEAFDDPLATHTFGRRYVFARLDQRTLAANIRLNWTFTPTLSLQLFAQPLISTGRYHDYGELARPRSYSFFRYGDDASTIDEEALVADPDGAGPAPSLELPRLDFNFASLRGTAVLRWEYLPGSTLYLVWTQQRSDSIEEPNFRLRPSVDQLWSAPMENVFVIKATYWLGR